MAGAAARSGRICFYFFLYRDSGRAVLSRMGPEFIGTADRAHGCADDDGSSVRAVALEQTDGELQLALCAAGCDRGGILWAGVAQSASCWRISVDPCDGRYFVVALVPVMLRRAIAQITEADAHVVDGRRGHGDGDGDSEDGVGHGQRPEIARFEKDEAGGEPPDQREHSEDRVGKVREREDKGGRRRSQRGAGNQPNEARQKVSLQQKLLGERPDGVAAEGQYPLRETVGPMKRVQIAG